ncbi:hypothetical protein XENOCAPTIV_029861 [Xenoophorus captivus]|uniref:Syndecan n=1 Tax=Xenoophorus captivus TaxID=1517983 RepID=A0ABV0R5M9_9TELE
MSTDGGDLEASGDSSNGSDFGFSDDEDDDYNNEYDVSGSGEGVHGQVLTLLFPLQPDINDNRIPDQQLPVRPTINEIDIVKNKNEIPPLGNTPGSNKENPSNVPCWRELATVFSCFSFQFQRSRLQEKPTNFWVLLKSIFLDVGSDSVSLCPPAVIAGCAVCLMFAVLLILLLIYRMKKKDEGSYDLGKKPIYKKAPTTEIYA